MKMPKFLKVLVDETKSIKELSVLSMAFKRLWNKSSKTGVVLAIIFSILEASLYVLDPVILRHLIDAMNKGYNFGWNQMVPNHIPFFPAIACGQATVWLTIVLVIFSVLWYAAFNISTGFARNATYQSQVTFGTEAFAHILNLSMDFHVKSRKGEILAKTDQAVREAQDFLYNSFFMNFLRASLSIALVLVVTYSMDWRLFTICFVSLAFGVYTNVIFGSRVSKEEKSAWQNVTDVTARSLDVMQNIKETKIFGNEEFEARRRQVEAEKQLIPLRKITLLWRWLTTIENLWQNLGFALAMFTVILPGIFIHKFTVGQVAQFVSYYLMLFGYFMDLLFKYLNAQRLVPKLKDMRKLLSLKASVIDLPKTVPFPGIKDRIYFHNVSFSYSRSGNSLGLPETLSNIYFLIPKGKITVLAGKTGCGKSTLANLLMRLYDPTAGEILVDGIDIRKYSLKSFHRSFAVLSQEAFLFNASVAFNIAYSRIDASNERIVEASKIAQAHEFIMQMSQGYDTIVSERAANISGGQKQRIALARAVLARDAEVVILDEPTTGLDNQTAREFLDELMQVFSSKTIIVITHDPAIMRRADQLVYMEDGKIKIIGTHDELVENCEGFKKLVYTD